MLFKVIFISALIALLLVKIKDISLRQNLNTFKERRLLLSGGLLILFLITSLLFPYPDSIYWFIVSAVLLVASSVSFDIMKIEIKRLNTLRKKDRILNVLFYSLIIVTTALYL